MHIPLISPLVDAFGVRPVAGIGLIFFLIRGIAVSAVQSVQLPFFRSIVGVVDSAEYQQCTSVILLAWALKPGAGLLSDSFPFRGYNKRSYMVAASGAAAFAALALAMQAMHVTKIGVTAVVVTVLFFAAQFGVAFVDLLTESTYAVMMRQRRDTGSSIVTLAFGLGTFGSIIASLVVGPLADAGRLGDVLLLAGVAMLTASVPPLLNWFSERPAVVVGGHHEHVGRSDGAAPHQVVEGDETEMKTLTATVPVQDNDENVHAHSGYQCENNPASSDSSCTATLRRWWHSGCQRFARHLKGEARRHPTIAAYACVMTAGTATAAVCGIHLSPWPRLWALTCIVGTLIALSFECLPRRTAMGNVFMFSCSALYVQIPGALDYFYLADEKCLPDGPHFDYTYYTTITGVVSCIAATVGVTLFEWLLSSGRYANVFCITTCAKVLASAVDWIIVTRTNKTVLGISDKSMYLWGDAAIFSAVQMMDFMPLVVLTSRLCPHGLEALMYAVLAGFSNFGLNVARTVGELLIRSHGVKSSVPCDFSGLPQVIVIAHAVFPLFTIPLAFLLLPKRSMRDPLVAAAAADDEGEDGNGGGTNDDVEDASPHSSAALSAMSSRRSSPRVSTAASSDSENVGRLTHRHTSVTAE